METFIVHREPRYQTNAPMLLIEVEADTMETDIKQGDTLRFYKSGQKVPVALFGSGEWQYVLEKEK